LNEGAASAIQMDLAAVLTWAPHGAGPDKPTHS